VPPNRHPSHGNSWFARGEYDRMLLTLRDRDPLDKLGTDSPMADDRISMTATYVLEPGRITRTDVYTPHGEISLKSLRMEFATGSSAASQQGTTTVFGRGLVRKFTAAGFEQCTVATVQDDVAYHTPTGPWVSRVLCESASRTLKSPIKMRWTLSYSDF
jgi:hypothetical protein